MMTDSQLIREIKDGNVELYSTLMGRYQKKILSFVYHMLKSAKLEILAEDIVRKPSTRHIGVYIPSGK